MEESLNPLGERRAAQSPLSSEELADQRNFMVDRIGDILLEESVSPASIAGALQFVVNDAVALCTELERDGDLNFDPAQTLRDARKFLVDFGYDDETMVERRQRRALDFASDLLLEYSNIGLTLSVEGGRVVDRYGHGTDFPAVVDQMLFRSQPRDAGGVLADTPVGRMLLWMAGVVDGFLILSKSLADSMVRDRIQPASDANIRAVGSRRTGGLVDLGTPTATKYRYRTTARSGPE